MKYLFSGVFLILALSGCSQPDETESEDVTSETQRTAEETAINADSEPDVAVVKELDEPKKTKKKLDLSIPVESAENNTIESDTKEKALLPDMFTKSEATTKIGGGVIRDGENEDYMDSIEGAKIDIEIKH